MLAVSEGRDDPSTRWPSADDLSGYYASAFPADPIHEPLEDDEGVTVANWSGAAEVEADVVVSLCRVGRRQIHAPERVEVRLLDEDSPEANPNLDFLFADLAEAITTWRDEGKRVLFIACKPNGAHPRSRPPISPADWVSRASTAFDRVRHVLPRCPRELVFPVHPAAALALAGCAGHVSSISR